MASMHPFSLGLRTRRRCFDAWSAFAGETVHGRLMMSRAAMHYRCVTDGRALRCHFIAFAELRPREESRRDGAALLPRRQPQPFRKLVTRKFVRLVDEGHNLQDTGDVSVGHYCLLIWKQPVPVEQTRPQNAGYGLAAAIACHGG